MRAMVLAAGRGERLRPLTDAVPKPLVPVAGKPLIHHILHYLRASGVGEVVINLHHLGGQIQDYVGDGRQWGLRIFYSWEPKLLGTGGGIQKPAPHLAGETFVVMNADILLELDLQDVLRRHREQKAVATLVLRRDPEAERFGLIETDGYGFVRRILGRPPGRKGPWSRWMFTGVHVIEPEVFGYMSRRQEEAFSIIDVYIEMLHAGERIAGYGMEGFWTDVGTPARYEALGRMLQSGEVSLDFMVGGGRAGETEAGGADGRET